MATTATQRSTLTSSVSKIKRAKKEKGMNIIFFNKKNLYEEKLRQQQQKRRPELI